MEKDPEATQDAFTGNLNLKDFKLIHSESFSVELSGFDLNKAKTVAIIGPSGSGKTSFIKSLAGLLKRISGLPMVLRLLFLKAVHL